MASPEPHWTAYLQALLAPAIALLAAVIGYGQWRTARNKLKLDLFERRFAIYDAARTFLGSIATSGRVKEEELTKFIVGTREARWVLNADLDDFLNKKVYIQAVHHQTTDDEMAFANAEERAMLVRAKAKQREELLHDYEVLNEKFKPFLSLEH